MRPMLSLFRRGDAAAASKATLTLPSAVCDAIDAASLVVRPGGEEGEGRVIFHFDGCRGFIFTDEGAGKVLASMFPELTERQQGQALQRIRSRVKARLRGLGSPEFTKRPWKDRY